MAGDKKPENYVVDIKKLFDALAESGNLLVDNNCTIHVVKKVHIGKDSKGTPKAYIFRV